MESKTLRSKITIPVYLSPVFTLLLVKDLESPLQRWPHKAMGWAGIDQASNGAQLGLPLLRLEYEQWGGADSVRTHSVLGFLETSWLGASCKG